MNEQEKIKKTSAEIAKLKDELKKEEQKVNKSIERSKEKERRIKERVRKHETKQKIVLGGTVLKLFDTNDGEKVLEEIRKMLQLQALLKSNGIEDIEDLKARLDGYNNDSY